MGKSSNNHPKVTQQRVQEITPPGEALEGTNDPDIPEVPDPPKDADHIRCGFYIAVTEDGQLRFDLIGGNQNIVDLLGLLKIAGVRINTLLDKHHGGRTTYLASKLDQAIGLLTQLTTITQNNQ